MIYQNIFGKYEVSLYVKQMQDNLKNSHIREQIINLTNLIVTK